jgi:hypothetical protein|tara:strand:- start:13164 stop:13451 length:288 start_codon:yes stop_codon:yes gene_type:complete
MTKEVSFSISDYEKMRSQWGQFVRAYSGKDGGVSGYLGIRFENNNLTVGYRIPKGSWNDKNCFTAVLPVGFADFEARFVAKVNDMISEVFRLGAN